MKLNSRWVGEEPAVPVQPLEQLAPSSPMDYFEGIDEHEPMSPEDGEGAVKFEAYQQQNNDDQDYMPDPLEDDEDNDNDEEYIPPVGRQTRSRQAGGRKRVPVAKEVIKEVPKMAKIVDRPRAVPCSVCNTIMKDRWSLKRHLRKVHQFSDAEVDGGLARQELEKLVKDKGPLETYAMKWIHKRRVKSLTPGVSAKDLGSNDKMLSTHQIKTKLGIHWNIEKSSDNQLAITYFELPVSLEENLEWNKLIIKCDKCETWNFSQNGNVASSCKIMSKIELHLLDHLLLSHVPDGKHLLRCRKCRKKFPGLRKLREHSCSGPPAEGDLPDATSEEEEETTTEGTSKAPTTAKASVTCPVCGTQLSGNWYLKRHLRQIHQIEAPELQTEKELETLLQGKGPLERYAIRWVLKQIKPTTATSGILASTSGPKQEDPDPEDNSSTSSWLSTKQVKSKLGVTWDYQQLTPNQLQISFANLPLTFQESLDNSHGTRLTVHCNSCRDWSFSQSTLAKNSKLMGRIEEFVLDHLLVRHLNDETFLKCQNCQKVFTRLRLRREHNDPEDCFKPKPEVEKKFQCAKCGYRSAEKKEMQHHEETHLDPDQRASVICDHCGKKLLKRSYKSHVKGHCAAMGQGIYSYPCEACGLDCVTKRGLEVHILRMHTEWPEGRLPWPCDLCNKQYKDKSHWKRHRRVVHNVDNFPKCPKGCGMVFSKDSSLLKHEKVCNGQKKKYKKKKKAKRKRD